MADTEKAHAEISKDGADGRSIREMDESHQENAVGYKEYREALDLEVSNKEVCSIVKRIETLVLG